MPIDNNTKEFFFTATQEEINRIQKSTNNQPKGLSLSYKCKKQNGQLTLDLSDFHSEESKNNIEKIVSFIIEIYPNIQGIEKIFQIIFEKKYQGTQPGLEDIIEISIEQKQDSDEKIIKLTSEKQALEQSKQTSEKTIAELQNKIDELTTEKETLEQKNRGFQAQVGQLTSEKQALEQQDQVSQKIITDLKQKIHPIQLQKNQLTSEKKALEQKEQEFKIQVEQLTTAKETLEQEIKDSNRDYLSNFKKSQLVIDSNGEKINELKLSLEQAQIALAAETEKVERLEEKVRQKENKIETRQADFMSEVQKFDIAKEKIAELDQAREKIAELDQARKNHADALQTLKSLTKEKSGLEKQIRKLNNEIDKKGKKISKIEGQVDTAEQENILATLNQDISDLNQKLEQKDTAIANKKSEITEQEQKIQSLTVDLVETKETFKEENKNSSILLQEIKRALKETSFADKCLSLSLGTGLGLSLSATGTLAALALTTTLLSPLGPTVVIGLIAGSALLSTTMLIGAIYLAVRKSATKNMRIALGGGVASGVSLSAAGALAGLAFTTALLSPLGPSIVMSLIAGSAILGIVMLLGTMVSLREKTQPSREDDSVLSPELPLQNNAGDRIMRQDSSSSSSSQSSTRLNSEMVMSLLRSLDCFGWFSSKPIPFDDESYQDTAPKYTI